MFIVRYIFLPVNSRINYQRKKEKAKYFWAQDKLLLLKQREWFVIFVISKELQWNTDTALDSGFSKRTNHELQWIDATG